MKVTVAACQQPLAQPLSAETKALVLDSVVDFLCLPEHYPLPRDVANLRQAASLFDHRYRYLADLSLEMKAVVVGGTLTERTATGFYNTCYVFENGAAIGYYRKVNPTAGEMAAGVLKGDEFKVFEARGLKFGVLICADVLDVASFDQLARLDCRITFVPTASPHRPGELVADKYERDRIIFLHGSKRMNCPIVKTCGVGPVFGHPLQGRSLIATPDEIVKRAEPDQEQSALLLIATLDI